MLTSTLKRISYLKVANPHWLIILFAALLWVYYLAQQVGFSGEAHLHHAHHNMHQSPETVFFKPLLDWMIMVYAMMLPMTSGTIRAIVNRIPVARQSRSLLIFVLDYSLIWLVFGLILFSASKWVETLSSLVTQANLSIGALAYLAAGVVSNADFRIRLLSACGSIWAPRIVGYKADLDIAKIGIIEGIKCVQTCAHIMVAMYIAGHNLMQMAVLTVALFYEKSRYRNKENLLRNTCFLLAIWELAIFYQ